MRYALACLPFVVCFCIGAFSGLGPVVAVVVPALGGTLSGHLVARAYLERAERRGAR